jgi:hypothetical protein
LFHISFVVSKESIDGARAKPTMEPDGATIDINPYMMNYVDIQKYIFTVSSAPLGPMWIHH